jgi:hypothetical protein
MGFKEVSGQLHEPANLLFNIKILFTFLCSVISVLFIKGATLNLYLQVGFCESKSNGKQFKHI